MCFVESDHSIGSVCILLKVIIASDVTLENPINQAICFCKELDLCLTSKFDQKLLTLNQNVQHPRQFDIAKKLALRSRQHYEL